MSVVKICNVTYRTVQWSVLQDMALPGQFYKKKEYYGYAAKNNVLCYMEKRKTMGKYFGTDGFRGEANVNLTVEHAFLVGRYIGWYFGQEHKAQKEALWKKRDLRKTTRALPALSAAMRYCLSATPRAITVRFASLHCTLI